MPNGKGTRMKGAQKPKKTQKKVATKTFKERRAEKNAAAAQRARTDRA